MTHGKTGIAALEAEMRDRLAAKDKELARVREELADTKSVLSLAAVSSAAIQEAEGGDRLRLRPAAAGSVSGPDEKPVAELPRGGLFHSANDAVFLCRLPSWLFRRHLFPVMHRPQHCHMRQQRPSSANLCGLDQDFACKLPVRLLLLSFRQLHDVIAGVPVGLEAGDGEVEFAVPVHQRS